jgi:LPXTG-site transpeptidase (sortase) family protein
MQKQISIFQRARFVSSSALLYVMTFALIGFAVSTPYVAAKPIIPSQPMPVNVQPNVPKIVEVSGEPNRITIPSRQLDLPVVPGTYDPSTDSWTLNGYLAQFATVSAPANNIGGETFIYGHNNDYVFGALRHVAPNDGDEAFVYTTNGHEFAYTFQKTWSVGPYDVTTLDYQGPSVLLIQTCTGSLNQYRTMYLFNFEKVLQ